MDERGTGSDSPNVKIFVDIVRCFLKITCIEICCRRKNIYCSIISCLFTIILKYDRNSYCLFQNIILKLNFRNKSFVIEIRYWLQKKLVRKKKTKERSKYLFKLGEGSTQINTNAFFEIYLFYIIS